MKKIITLMVFCLSCFTSVVYAAGSITDADIHKAQQEWASGIVAIGKAYTNKKDYVTVAKNLIN